MLWLLTIAPLRLSLRTLGNGDGVLEANGPKLLACAELPHAGCLRLFLPCSCNYASYRHRNCLTHMNPHTTPHLTHALWPTLDPMSTVTPMGRAAICPPPTGGGWEKQRFAPGPPTGGGREGRNGKSKDLPPGGGGVCCVSSPWRGPGASLGMEGETTQVRPSFP